VIEFDGIIMRIAWKTGDGGESDDACSADRGAANLERTGGECVGKSDRAD